MTRQHIFPWFSLTIHLYWSLLLVSPLDSIQCSYRASGCKFLIFGQHCFFCVKYRIVLVQHSIITMLNLMWLLFLLSWKYTEDKIWPCRRDFFSFFKYNDTTSYLFIKREFSEVLWTLENVLEQVCSMWIGLFVKKINVSFIVHFHFGKYSFSPNSFFFFFVFFC